jgi:hypothetical protein
MSLETRRPSRSWTRVLGALLPWREVVFPWLVSRLYSCALIVGAASIGNGGVRWAGFAKWDGGWYLLIARFGYGPDPTNEAQTAWPFFPLFPGTIRALGELGLPDRGATIILDQLVFLVALAGVWRIARAHTGDGPARLAVWAIAVFPGAFVFSMIYPSSIFLAATVWAFVLVEERKDWAASALVVVTALVRPNGLVLAVALLFAVGTVRRAVVVCGPAVLAVLLWCARLWWMTDDPLVFLTAKEQWPEVTVKTFLLAPQDHDYVFPHLGLAVIALVALFLVRKRLPLSWTAFSVLYLVPSLGLGMVGLGRYANECFPPFVAAGELLHRARSSVRVAAFTVCVGFQALCAWWVIHDIYVP